MIRSGPSTSIAMPLSGIGDDVEQPAQLAAQLLHARALRDAEHGAQDDLERHRLHARAQRIGLAQRPALDLLARRRRPSARRSAASARRGTRAASACAGAGAGASSSSSTESGPSTGSRMRFASPACSRRGSPVNTCLIVSGSDVTTHVPSLAIFNVNMSPKRAWHWSISHCARRYQITVCTARGRRGPGGRPICSFRIPVSIFSDTGGDVKRMGRPSRLDGPRRGHRWSNLRVPAQSSAKARSGR